MICTPGYHEFVLFHPRSPEEHDLKLCSQCVNWTASEWDNFMLIDESLGISLGYRIDLHVYSRGSVTVVRPEKCFVESTKILLNQQKFPLAHI